MIRDAPLLSHSTAATVKANQNRASSSHRLRSARVVYEKWITPAASKLSRAATALPPHFCMASAMARSPSSVGAVLGRRGMEMDEGCDACDGDVAPCCSPVAVRADSWLGSLKPIARPLAIANIVRSLFALASSPSFSSSPSLEESSSTANAPSFACRNDSWVVDSLVVSTPSPGSLSPPSLDDSSSTAKPMCDTP
eukprot:scaffold36827_cov33-Tisochrysis_lutea.AAC.2